MDPVPEIDLDVSTCRRIVALLMSLAVLAERAAARSLPVRLYFLWLLGRAETVTLTLFADPTDADDASGEMSAVAPCDPGVASRDPVVALCDPVVALCDLRALAVRLRMLALLLAHLCLLLPRTRRRAGRMVVDLRALRVRPVRRATPIEDTS